MAKRAERSIFERLIYLGIATFFLWPFVQLWSIKALPLFESDVHLRATVALENLMEEAMSLPFEPGGSKTSYVAIKDCEDIGLMGRLEITPHHDFNGNLLVRAQVRWGFFPFSKTLSLEYLRARTRP